MSVADRKRRDRPRAGGRLWLALLLVLAWSAAAGGEVTVAVASNFAGALERLREPFEAQSGHRLQPVVGSSGKLYAQIRHGAPYDVLLSADRARPERLEREGQAVAGSRFTYALGRLVLWSREPAELEITAGAPAALGEGRFRKLAMAHPELAPYGTATRETLARLELLDTLRPKLVRGENIAQAYALVASGNAELGFVARSQLRSQVPSESRSNDDAAGSVWLVPAELHAPIRQDAVLLKRAADRDAAESFLRFLRGNEARALLGELGYDLP